MSTDRRNLAPASTLLGQLQRGRGAGYRDALRRPSEAGAAVFACVADDPRWDRQLEDRGDYYARLLLHFESDLALLRRLLREDDPDEWGVRLWLPLEVLEELGRRGRRDACALLRGYAEQGRHWLRAVAALQNSGRPEAWEGLLGTLHGRFSSREELAEELASELDPDRDPVPAWRVESPELNAAYLRQSVERALHPTRAALVAHYESLSVAESFARADRREVTMLGRALRNKVRPTDRPLLLQHLHAGGEAQFILALYGLAALGEPQDWHGFQEYVETCSEPPGFFWGHLVRIARAFPPAVSLPSARIWFDAKEKICAHLGRLLLAMHAEPQDLERLVAAIDPALAGEEMYHLCSALEGLIRLPAMGRLPEVERAFEEATYAWARREAANAMLIHSPEHFVRTYAAECLWDAEPQLRILGCRHADRTQAAVTARLSEIQTDPCEDEDVQQALGLGP